MKVYRTLHCGGVRERECLYMQCMVCVGGCVVFSVQRQSREADKQTNQFWGEIYIWTRFILIHQFYSSRDTTSSSVDIAPFQLQPPRVLIQLHSRYQFQQCSFLAASFVHAPTSIYLQIALVFPFLAPSVLQRQLRLCSNPSSVLAPDLVVAPAPTLPSP